MGDAIWGLVRVGEPLGHFYFFFIALEMHTAAPPQVMLNPKINMMVAAVDISEDLPDRKQWRAGLRELMV
jgi:hypothetical protein